jgi:hypothetical protein
LFGYYGAMQPTRNLADPDYEPTDAELAELMRSAFAGIAEAQDRSRAEMRERIRRAGAEGRRRSADQA